MLFQEGFHTYYIYILTNKPKTVFYTGVTNNLRKRLNQHQENILSHNKTFAWRREKKIELIKTINSDFEFLNYLFE